MNTVQLKMKSLLTQVKHAKITSREVFIHLRKTGELKRKSYQKYLKLQYRLASDTYEMLHDTENNFENQSNNPNEKKLTMPVHLVKSELPAMGKSFEDISFLTEAWHFFQKENMRTCSCKPSFSPVSEFTKTAGLASTGSTKQNDKYFLNNEETRITNKNSLQTKYQSTLTLSPASGFDKLNQYSNSPRKNTPLCIQVLKWAQEGKLNLN